MTPKEIFVAKINMVSKNAEFYTDFKFGDVSF